ncbi:MAG TPA: potassium channel protein [Euzebyales bacterium]|nr:potassium channel protein [Euzebyales bacterium]
MRRSPTRRLQLALVVFTALTIFGTAGYMVLGDAPLMDALHMTIITIAAVGYSESIALEGTARLFTLVVIILGVGTITLVMVSGIDFLLEGHLEELLGRRRMDRDLARLNNHTIVCGFGQVGRHVAFSLVGDGEPVVVLDVHPERVEIARTHRLLAVEGDATQDDTLARVGIARARAVVACVHDDADNVLISLTAKGLHPEAFVIARIKRDENEAKVRRAGADRVIAPAAIGGRRIATLVTRPGVVDFLDVVTHGTQEDLVLEEVVVLAGGPLEGRSLRQLRMRERHGITVLAVRPQGLTANSGPDPDIRLRAGDLLVVIASRNALNELRR